MTRAQRLDALEDFLDAQVQARFTAALRSDLDSGDWDRRFGALRERPYLEGPLVIVRSVPEADGR